VNVAPAANVCPAVADSMQLFIHAYPQFDFTGDLLEACEPLTVNFSSTQTSSNIPASQLSYAWDFGNGGSASDANPQGIQYPNWGKYNVSLTMVNTAGPCSTTVSKPAYVDVWPVPVADFTSDPSYYTTIALPKFQFFTKSRIADNSILKHYWNFGTGLGKDSSTKRDPGFAYGKDTAIYDVTLIVVSDKGCTDTMVRPVKIGPDIIVFIPNAFTPDDAGPNGNNRFLPFVQNFDSYHMTIFNRWGEKLFETTDATIGWDGTYQGAPVQQDVYAYVVEVSSADGKSYKFPGTVTLLR
jgi:gliding motility-associated-like protein